MPRFFGLLFLILISYSSFSQKSDEKFVFAKYNNGKEKKLKVGTEVGIFFEQDTNLLDSVSMSAYGRLQSLSESDITIDLDMQFIGHYFTIDSIQENYVKYSYVRNTEYPVQNIAYLTYEPRAKTALQFMAFVSVASAVILAPVLSYNMRTDTFDGEAYLSIVKPAVVASLITVPLLYRFEEKKVTIKKP